MSSIISILLFLFSLFNLLNPSIFIFLYFDISFSSINKSQFKYSLYNLNKEKKNNNIEIIEDKDVNLCDINFNIYQNKYYIKDYKNIRSIYCEDEIQNINFISIIEYIINKNGFINLKYINLTIGNISDNLLNISSKSN